MYSLGATKTNKGLKLRWVWLEAETLVTHIHVHTGLAFKRGYLEWSTSQTVPSLIKSLLNGRVKY